jgi:hypothetical protein
MFPADQNIARPVVALHSIRNAVRVVAVAVRVDCEAEIFREGLYGLVGAGAFAAWVGLLVLLMLLWMHHVCVQVATLLTFLRRLCQDVADVVA